MSEQHDASNAHDGISEDIALAHEREHCQGPSSLTYADFERQCKAKEAAEAITRIHNALLLLTHLRQHDDIIALAQTAEDAVRKPAAEAM